MIDRAMIVVGAGSSRRFGSDKLMSPVAGLPLIAHTVVAVSGLVDECILVCREDQMPALELLDLGAVLVPGGPTRTASEMAGLAAIGDRADLIGVHDGARPLVASDLIEALFEAAAQFGGAIPIVEPIIPLVHKSGLTRVAGAVFAQTPQVFRGEDLVAAYLRAARIEYEGQDTAEIAQKFSGLEIAAIPGDPSNIKVTFPEDLESVREALEISRSGPR
jgi:2-C-methyl-D-erythritol 4-phosphate cytidylyltransferase